MEHNTHNTHIIRLMCGFNENRYSVWQSFWRSLVLIKHLLLQLFAVSVATMVAIQGNHVYLAVLVVSEALVSIC